MAYDPFYTSSPSDSGLIDPAELAAEAARAKSKAAGDVAKTNVPPRDEYRAPTHPPVDTEAVEESLQEVPLPTGFMSRLRGFVNEL